MTRKMLKKEKELRAFLRREILIYDEEWGPVIKDVGKLITALVKAVRLDERMANQCDCDECRNRRRAKEG